MAQFGRMAKTTLFKSLVSSPGGLFVVLALIIVTFIGMVWFAGYLWALIVSAVVAGFVLWGSMTKTPETAGADVRDTRE